MMESGELVAEHLRLRSFPGILQQACVKMCCLSQITSAATAFYLVFFETVAGRDFLFFFLSLIRVGSSLGSCYVQLMCQWLCCWARGCWFCKLCEPASPEGYSGTGGVIKLVSCRNLRYFFHVLLEESSPLCHRVLALSGDCRSHTVLLSRQKVIDLQCSF